MIAIANLAMVTGNIGRSGVGVNPLRGQNNVQGSCDMGSFPARIAGLPSYLGRRGPQAIRSGMERQAEPRAGPAHPQYVRRRDRRHVHGDCTCRAKTSCNPDPNTKHVVAALSAMECVIVHDLFPERDPQTTPTSSSPAQTFLEKDGTFTQRRTAHPARAQGDEPAQRLCGLGDHHRPCRGRWAKTCTTIILRRSWTRSPP